MAGVKLKIEADTKAALQALSLLAERVEYIEPALRDLGEDLLNATRARFETATAPDGSHWHPLSPRYQRRKKRHKDDILILEGILLGNLNYQVQGNVLEVGSPTEYAATHQFGMPEWGLEARPFLGLSGEDEVAVREIMNDHLARAIGG